MNILFIDDQILRLNEFEKSIADYDNSHTIVWANSTDLAISFLSDESTKYGYIFLDHDLNIGPTINANNNGQLIAEYIVNNKKKFKFSKIFIHSFNMIAAHNMYVTLKEAQLNVIMDCGCHTRAKINPDNKSIYIKDKFS